MSNYNEILNRLIINEKYRKNKEIIKNEDYLKNYYDIGKLIVEDGIDSDSKIVEYYNNLNNDLKKKCSLFNLKNIRRFYFMCKGGMVLTGLLTWSHYVELIKLDNIDEVNNYILTSIDKCLSVRQLRLKIKAYKSNKSINNNYTNSLILL